MSKRTSNLMNLHNREYHGNEIVDWSEEDKLYQFDFKPIGGQNKVLERQVSEYSLIDKAETEGVIKCGQEIVRVDKKLMNTKFEYFGTRGYRMED